MKKTIKGKFKPSTVAEKDLYRSLKRVAEISGAIIDSHVEGLHILDGVALDRELQRYSKKLGPWAERQSKKLLDTVKNSNRRAYKKKSEALSEAIDLQKSESQITTASLLLQAEQVELIKSIPLEAGYRAQAIALEAAIHGRRAIADPEIIKDLKKRMDMTTEVATSRALLIARTETARANASINEIRSRSVGSKQYRWHNSGDGAVRDSHRIYKGKKLQGQIFSWDKPPTLSDGMTGHPGTFPNCRCFAEPVFDTE